LTVTQNIQIVKKQNNPKLWKNSYISLCRDASWSSRTPRSWRRASKLSFISS